ncbi:GNAT family N-acetyltransferase [Nocardioides sp. zg-579]|uniref:GNAT family N-acetyltransferase n=1 Tax=Nocardioides marmotae TaxID=2663857 RepID=A0A6I3JF34_9ACTN|nr:GNAT family N-acetyltransferase [Nocardioides marmotae]MCR6032908.1 GNAT family N-acetyltransferase [Gordonia jinghuaiqii]MTB96558.1 GNAT family N-acetyltransferase [Nocardioides marmotae]QKE01923.1 GNAT family N-acetyltransferase [Nocardioides marmotae]
MSDLRLRPLRTDDEAEALRAHEELAADGFEFVLGWSPERTWADLLAQYERERVGLALPEGRVPAAFLVAEVDGEIVGRLSVRFALNDWLAAYGGHVGYGVRPAHRRRGYATEILRQSLVLARAGGVDRVLVTCDDDNLASAATIERCGGVLEDVREQPGEPVAKRRYWIG